MILSFILRREFGRDRYFPVDTAAAALVSLTGRKCFKEVELLRLQAAGFVVRIGTAAPAASSRTGGAR